MNPIKWCLDMFWIVQSGFHHHDSTCSTGKSHDTMEAPRLVEAFAEDMLRPGPLRLAAVSAWDASWVMNG